MNQENKTLKGLHCLNGLEKVFAGSWPWCLLPLCLFTPMSLHNFISHSEFWSITSGQLFGQFSPESLVIYYRPAFYAFLKMFYFLPVDNVLHIKLVRLSFGILASINVFLIATIVFQWTHSRKLTIFYLIFLFTFHTFFYNFFRVRSDMLALFFILLALYYTNQQFSKHQHLFKWSIILFLFLAFLSTPKAIFLIFSFSAYCFYLEKNTSAAKKQTWLVLIYFLIPVLFISIVSISLLVLGFSEWNPFIFALIYFLNNISNVFTYSGWGNIAISLHINFLHFFLIGLGYVFIFKEKWDHYNKAPWILVLWITLFFLLYAEKWDYFFASLLPFMALPSIIVLKKILEKKGFLIFLLPLFITPFYMTYFTGWSFSNKKQLEVITELGNLVRQVHQSTYFDSTGILPRHPVLLSFFGPGDESSYPTTMHNVISNTPTFIFYTHKVSLGGPKMLNFLHQNYIEVQEDIWVYQNKINQIKTTSLSGKPTSLDHLFIYDRRPFTRKLLSTP